MIDRQRNAVLSDRRAKSTIDGEITFPVGLQGHVICCSGRQAYKKKVKHSLTSSLKTHCGTPGQKCVAAVTKALCNASAIRATTAEKLEGTSWCGDCGVDADLLSFPPPFLPPVLTLFAVGLPLSYPCLPYTLPLKIQRLKSYHEVCVSAISFPLRPVGTSPLMVF